MQLVLSIVSLILLSVLPRLPSNSRAMPWKRTENTTSVILMVRSVTTRVNSDCMYPPPQGNP